MLVLITAVLVAIVAIAVIGMAGNQPGYVVGVTASAAPSGNDAVVTLYGSKNIPELVKVEVIDAGSSAGEYVEVWNGTAGSAPVGIPLTAKKVARPSGNMSSYATKLLVRGTFADGTEQVLLMQDAAFKGVEEVVEYILYNKVEWKEYYDKHYDDPGETVTIPQKTLLDFGDGEYLYFIDNSDSNKRVMKGVNRDQYWDLRPGQCVKVDITPELVRDAISGPITSQSVGKIKTLYNIGGILKINLDNYGGVNLVEIGTIVNP
ncbi:hypothetical protein McpAg1_05500 [Methanocorpusculaceae archaeon Ag1]|uniref:Archaeal Type IV pilin N-terminal domain-containing protein n=2 Tax=Methanorbis furvi TaxID=3028299 RepID=A0AAE4S9W6_9EURY|nr:hypothetical protein [Methanocorpusculaceae archaeon Ag1]